MLETEFLRSYQLSGGNPLYILERPGAMAIVAVMIFSLGDDRLVEASAGPLGGGGGSPHAGPHGRPRAPSGARQRALRPAGKRASSTPHLGCREEAAGDGAGGEAGPGADRHPNLPLLYRKKEELEAVLADPKLGPEAMDAIRAMIARIVLTPRAAGGMEAVLEGDLARILAICAGAEHANARLGGGRSGAVPVSQVSAAAGARNHRELPTIRAVI